MAYDCTNLANVGVHQTSHIQYTCRHWNRFTSDFVETYRLNSPIITLPKNKLKLLKGFLCL